MYTTGLLHSQERKPILPDRKLFHNAEMKVESPFTNDARARSSIKGDWCQTDVAYNPLKIRQGRGCVLTNDNLTQPSQRLCPPYVAALALDVDDDDL